MSPPKTYQKKRKEGSSSGKSTEPLKKKTNPATSSQPNIDPTPVPATEQPQLPSDKVTPPALQPEPTQKRAKSSTSTQPNPASTTNPPATQPTVQPQPNPPSQNPVSTEQNPKTTETIMQVVQQLNEEERNEEGEVGDENEEEEAVDEDEEEGVGEPYDDFRFSGARAQKNFEKYWRKRSVIVERGMNLSHFQNEEFNLKQNFERRGWTKWAQFSGVAVVPIVQEFYANIREIKHEGKDCIVTKVRGVDFKIYPKDIRKFFGLKEVKDPEYPFAKDEALDKDSLARTLTDKVTAQWGHKMNLAKNRLTPKFNALHFLACSQLQPILNTSEVSYEKALLLYAIDEGLKIELGKIVFDNIASLFKTRKGISSLPFAGFITKFVCKKKVVSELGEQVAKPLGPISASSTERSASHKKGKGEATNSEFMEKMYSKWDEVNVELGEIKAEQYWIKQELKNQGKKIARMETKLDMILKAVTESQSPHSIG